jgi:predicted TIM-barrel fold metal-dependent hydrolase
MSAVIDCDVHAAVPGPAALEPHLERHWVDYLRDAEYRQPYGIRYTYPDWCEMLAPPDRPGTLDGLRAHTLDGVAKAVVHTYYGLETQTHPYLARALAAAVNRWVQTEWLDAEPKLLASVAIPPQDTEGAVAEIRRAAGDPRFVSVLLPARSWEPYGAQRYWPIWEAATEAGMALTIAYGGTSGAPPTPNGWVYSLFEEYAGSHQVFAAQVTSLVASGIFKRLPALRVIVTDSGWTWLPGLIWRMDAEWKAARREVPWLDAPPSEWVRRHIRLTTQPIDAEAAPAALRAALEQLGSDELLLFGSDYPRRHALDVDSLLALLEPEQAERLLWRNAQETLGLDGS